MNGPSKRNALLASLGLSALGIYILACTSFSPDDTKVIYPAFDSASGSVGVAVYDREERRSGMLFVPVDYESDKTNARPAAIALRAQWVGNGSHIAVAYVPSGSSQKDAFNIAVLPLVGRKPVRIFHVPDVQDAAQRLASPLCIAGDKVILPADNSRLMQVDLTTGTLISRELKDPEGELSLYPSAEGTGVFYFKSGQATVFGRLNPSDYSQTPLVVITNQLRDQTAVAYDNAGTTLALLTGDEDKLSLYVWRDGKSVFTRDLANHGRKRVFGNAILDVSGKAVRATFQEATGTNATAYGLMEVPFNNAPPREVVLIKAKGRADESDAYYFQLNVSHDGKTAAIASTYLAFSDVELDPADIALFFVDLSDPNWKVSKVPIPLPATRPRPMK